MSNCRPFEIVGRDSDFLRRANWNRERVGRDASPSISSAEGNRLHVRRA